MKSLLTVSLLLIAACAFSQHRSLSSQHFYDSVIRRSVEGHIRDNPRSEVTTIGASTATADVITVPFGTRKVVTISVKAISQGNDAISHKMLVISNIDGVYDIPHNDSTTYPLKGTGALAGIKWEVKLVKNKVLVQVTGVAGQTIRWFPSKKEQ